MSKKKAIASVRAEYIETLKTLLIHVQRNLTLLEDFEDTNDWVPGVVLETYIFKAIQQMNQLKALLEIK